MKFKQIKRIAISSHRAQGIFRFCSLWFFFSLFFCFPGFGNIENTLFFENISVREGLSNFQVTSICQDELGYVWIGTARGLNRYDGTNFQQYFFDPENADCLSADYISDLVSFKSGVFITTTRGLHYFDLKKEKMFTVTHDVHWEKNACVWNDKLYVVSTNFGLTYFDENSYKLLPVPGFSSSEKIFRIFSDSLNGIWCTLTDGRAIVLYNPENNNLTFFEPSVVMDTTNVSMVGIIKYGYESLWIGTNNGLGLMDPDGQETHGLLKLEALMESLKGKDIRFIEFVEDKVLIGTYIHGLYLYYPITGKTDYIAQNTNSTIETNSLTAGMVDHDQNIWIGTFNKGIVVNYKNHLNFNPNEYINTITRDRFINCIIADSTNQYFFGTRYNGLIHFDAEKLRYSTYETGNSGLKDDHITALMLDSRGYLWIGQPSALQKFHPGTGKFISLQIPEYVEEVTFIMESEQGHVYVCGFYGIYEYHLDGTFLRHITDAGSNPRQALQLDENTLLIATHMGGLFTYSISKNEVTEIKPDIDSKAWSEKEFNTIYLDNDSILWIGNFKWGLFRFDLKTRELKIYNQKNGLPSNDIIGIIEDHLGNMWLSTSYGLSCFDKKDNFINYFYDEGVNNQQFHQKAVFKDKNGTIFFGGNEGVTHFNPEEILRRNDVHPRIILTSLNINYELVSPEDDHKVLHHTLAYTDNFTLNYKQRSFSINYVGFNYGLAKNMEYSHFLEGYDEDWRNVGNDNRALYSNLPPGNYIFKVKAYNSETGWSDPAEVKIKVKQTPWLSYYSILAYILIIFAIMVMTFRLILKAKLYKKDLEIEQKERSREHEVHLMKLKFFTNISHELRTPLTVISAMFFMLQKFTKLTDKNKDLFKSMRLNIERLLKLINQLLLFRDMDNDTLRLHLKGYSIRNILDHVLSEYSYFAKLKKINLSISDEEELTDTVFWYDYDKLDKIFANLISNAIKHTSQDGEIIISFRGLTKDQVFDYYQKFKDYSFPVSDHYVEFTVEDTGSGISEEEQQHIFERYRKSSGNDLQSDYSSSGIGLDFTKRLINMHYGDIRVESEVDQGSRFSFILSLDKGIYSGEDIYDAAEEIVDHREDGLKYHHDIVSNSEVPSENRNFKIVVVEDNEELCMLMVKILSQKFQVFHAFNGLDGYKLIEKELPNLIISDIMMPLMDGLTLCENIKNNDTLNHIYLILLSAKSELDDQIIGFKKGADIYINKPFNIDYLLAVVDSQYEKNKRLNSIFNTGGIPRLEKNDVNSEYLVFVEKLNEIMKKEVGNEQLSVEIMAQGMNMSRSNFYRKFVSITGDTPNNYITKYRINRSIELMQATNKSISEICIQVGFNSQTYFSTLFKKEKGVSPSEFMKQNR